MALAMFSSYGSRRTATASASGNFIINCIAIKYSLQQPFLVLTRWWRWAEAVELSSDNNTFLIHRKILNLALLADKLKMDQILKGKIQTSHWHEKRLRTEVGKPGCQYGLAEADARKKRSNSINLVGGGSAFKKTNVESRAVYEYTSHEGISNLRACITTSEG